MKFLLPLFMLISFALTGCGGGSGSSVAQSDPEIFEFKDEDTYKQIVNNFKAFCSSSKECSPSVGALLIKRGQRSVGTCTGFLIQEDIFVVNAHCIKEDNLSGACEDMTIHFPAVSKYPLEKKKCQRVLAYDASIIRHPQIFNVLDYVFLKIERSARPTLKVSYEGVENKSQVKIWSMTFQPEVGQATLKSQNCIGIQKTIFTPNFINAKSPLIHLGGCNIIPGNSGSPVLNTQGEVVGIVAQQILTEKLKKEDFRLKSLIPAARATNFACIPYDFISGQNRQVSDDCKGVGEEAEKDAIGNLYAEVFTAQKNLVEKKLLAFADLNKKYFLWDGASVESKGVDGQLIIRLGILPYCIIQKEKENKNRPIKLSIPVWDLEETVDKYGRLSFRPSQDKQIQAVDDLPLCETVVKP